MDHVISASKKAAITSFELSNLDKVTELVSDVAGGEGPEPVLLTTSPW